MTNSASQSTDLPSPSPIRRTTDSLIAAFNAMDIPAIVALRSPTCTREILPKSLGFAMQDNETYTRSLQRLIPIFRNFSLAADDFIEDPVARRMSVCLRARADTAAGEYINEYIWLLSFDEAGTSIVGVKEFVDTGVYRDFWPLLATAMANEKARRESGVVDSDAATAPAPAADGLKGADGSATGPAPS